MKSLQIDRPTLDDPLYMQKNPHQVFLLVFTLFASTTLLTQGHSPSQVMNAETNPTAQLLWGYCLMVGSLLALVGEFWKGHTWNALALERSGLMLIGGASALYCLVLYNSPSAVNVEYVVGVTAAYAASCLWRVAQITVRLRWIRQVIKEMNARHA